MSNYKKHWIELRLPSQRTDGTWSCRYVIFEFATTRWRCNKGSSDGKFASREEAQAAALNQAQRVIDSFTTTV